MFGLKNRAAEGRANVGAGRSAALESLEGRVLFAGVTLVGSQAVFTADQGTTQNPIHSTMWVKQPDTMIRFYYSNVPNDANPPQIAQIAPGSISSFKIEAYEGNDYVQIGGSVPGAKTPYVYGGLGDDTLLGGPGGDVLMGGDGNDYIRGQGGPDLEIGGAGQDNIAGEDNQDIIFANSTTHESSTTSLGAILAEWKRNDITTNDRIGHILGGGGLNGNVVFNSSTVINDGVADTLAGSDDTDWFVCGVTDNCNDKLSGEVRTNF